MNNLKNTTPKNSQSKNFLYEKLDDQPSDQIAHYLDNLIVDLPTVLVNKLPVDITVILEKRWSDLILNAGILRAKGNLSIPYNRIEDGDLLHFLDENKKFITKSHRVTKRTGKILVGNVSVNTKTYKRDIHPGADLSSVNMHNMLPWPLAIYMSTGTKNHGSKTPAVLLDPNTLLGDPNHHGDKTMTPSVYFDNLGFGINIGTIFNVVAVMRNKKPDELSVKKMVYLFSFKITSTDNADIFIGDVNPIIGESNFTDVSPPLHEKNTTGRAIYRLGESQDSMGNVGNIYFPDGKRTITSKNYAGFDKNRNTINTRNDYSTVPSAKYKMLSGNNVFEMCG